MPAAPGYQQYLPAEFGQPRHSHVAVQSKRRPWKPILLAGIAILAVAGGVLAFTGGADKPVTTLTGTMVLTDPDTAAYDCIGQDGYSDISPGATVILTNESGKILGSTVLENGTADLDLGTCTYAFSLPDVPVDQAQYAVEVTSRGKVVSSRAEMVAQSWSFELTLGD